MAPSTSTTSQPPNKKVKVAEVTDRKTRSTATSSTATPAPSAAIARQYDSDDYAMVGSDDDDEAPFEYESDYEEPVKEVESIEIDDDDEEEGEEEGGQLEEEVIMITDESDLDEPPPEPINRSTGKLTSRKQFNQDIQSLVTRYGAADGEQVRDLRRDDEQITFNLVHPAFPTGLKLVLDTPDLGGYPDSHQVMCYAACEIGSDVQAVLAEVADLPSRINRSLPGLIDYLVSRLILHQPAPFVESSQIFEDDEEDEDDGDDLLFGIGGTDTGHNKALMDSLRNDFKGILDAGFRPGYTRVSELDNIVSVSKKVNALGVPLRALQAWDSELLTGEVRYLVLLMNFGSKYPDPDNGGRGDVKFRVGLSPKYKPSKAAMASAFRSHSANTYTKNDFDPISLSRPLDSLFSDKFQEILLTRRSNVNVGWAAAEHHCLEPGNTKEAINTRQCRAADVEEDEISGSYELPEDPMGGDAGTFNNYPLLAYTYLIRRFVMCPRFCLICFKKITTGIAALKPFVCESELCLFQLISMGLGPSLEHEITTNSPAVDLLVQLAYSATKENRLKADMQPSGLELEVPKNPLAQWKTGEATVKFDDIADLQVRNNSLASLITELPPIPEMQAWLNGDDLNEVDKSLSRNRKLQDMRKGSVSNSAWKLLRWIVASNTSYLKLIEEEDELVQGVPKEYRQFRLVVGSPAKEHLLETNIAAAQAVDANALRYPTLYAWHGSAVKVTWFHFFESLFDAEQSKLRPLELALHLARRTSLQRVSHFPSPFAGGDTHHNLRTRTINGRAYGHGVAKQGEISLGTYAQYAGAAWKGADFGVGRLASICEIVNKPQEFISTTPYLVVDKVDWIQCRYLIVQRGATSSYTPIVADSNADESTTSSSDQITQLVPLDPAHPITLHQKCIGIPDLLPKLEAMNQRLDDEAEDLNLSDTEVLKERLSVVTGSPKKSKKPLGPSSSRAQQLPKKAQAPEKPEDPFVPVGAELLKLIRVLPPPANPNLGSVRQITQEMRKLVKEQERDGPSTAGFYLDPERSHDNIFTWVLELCGFDPDLPLSKDMKKNGVTSLLMEVRFPESFPLSPPFFRIIYPRFLPFVQGGGGHVTAGGSLCMDLLTSSGWSPAYDISAVLLQIRMAISNTEPRPARLDPQHWELAYTMSEAVAGFERAAATHNWIVPPELKQLTRSF
ncbi:ubiquitin-conjugating enzyme E2 Q, partial [Phenoliferia sp. Uapishka_3]